VVALCYQLIVQSCYDMLFLSVCLHQERMVSCAEPPKLVPVTVEFASSPKATGGGGDFLDESSPESFPPDTTLRVPAGLAFPPVTTRQLAQVTINIFICYIHIYMSDVGQRSTGY